MSAPKRILVTGSTGHIGRHVVKALAAHNSLHPSSFVILAVTRNPNSANAQKLLSLPGVQLLKGDLNRPHALFADAGGDVYGVFSVQMSLDNPDKGLAGEVRQGKGLADAAKEHGKVQHFIYSGIDRAGIEQTNIGHFDTKQEIEDHIHSLNLPATILRPTILMDGFLNEDWMQTKVLATAITQQTFTRPERMLQLVACEDVGRAAAVAFANPSDWIGQSLSLAGDEITMPRFLATYRRVKGRELPTTFWIFPVLLKWFLPDVGKMLKFCDETGFKADLEETRRRLGGKVKDWEEFVETDMSAGKDK